MALAKQVRRYNAQKPHTDRAKPKMRAAHKLRIPLSCRARWLSARAKK